MTMMTTRTNPGGAPTKMSGLREHVIRVYLVDKF